MNTDVPATKIFSLTLLFLISVISMFIIIVAANMTGTLRWYDYRFHFDYVVALITT